MTICYRIAYDETFTATHILVPHGRELNLSSSVEYVQQSGLIVNYRLLLIRILCTARTMCNDNRERCNRRLSTILNGQLTNCGVMVVQETVAHELQGNSCWCACVYACVCVCVLFCVHAKLAERTKHTVRFGGWELTVKQSVKEIEIIY